MLQRQDVVDFIAANPGATSAHLAAHFQKAGISAVRSALYSLRKDGYIRITGTIKGARGQSVFLFEAGDGPAIEGTSIIEEEIDYEANDLRWRMKCAALSSSGRTVDFGSTKAGSNPAGAST